MKLLLNSFFILLIAFSTNVVRAKEFTPNFDTDIPNYFTDFGFTMIETTYTNNQLQRTMLVLSRKDAPDGRILVTLQTPNPNSPGRIEVEIGGESNITLEIVRTEKFEEGKRLFDEGKYLEALKILRPIAYPFFRYVDLPRESFDIHDIADMTLTAMFRAKQYSELANVLGRFRFDRIDPRYMSMALAVANAFIDNQDYAVASQLFEKIPFEATDREQRILAMRFTEALREVGEYRRAQFFYRRLAGLDDFIYKAEAELWIAYCNLRLNQPELTRIVLKDYSETDRSDRVFSLSKLIGARLAIADENYDNAIRLASEATVFSRLGYSWIPELLFTNALCYEKLNQQDVATNVYNQVIIFFGESTWAKKSEERITEIAPEAERLRKLKEERANAEKS